MCVWLHSVSTATQYMGKWRIYDRMHVCGPNRLTQYMGKWRTYDRMHVCGLSHFVFEGSSVTGFIILQALFDLPITFHIPYPYLWLYHPSRKHIWQKIVFLCWPVCLEQFFSEHSITLDSASRLLSKLPCSVTICTLSFFLLSLRFSWLC